MSEKTTGTTVYELNRDDLPTMSPEQMQRLRDLKDDDIDFSDAPRRPHGTEWLPIRRGEVVWLEKDVLEFFGTEGKADAAKVNAALREYMATHAKAS